MGSMFAEDELAAFAFERVDAARRAMQEPDQAGVATGRLFFAKRVHEAAKSGFSDIDKILRDLMPLLNQKAKEGARLEHQVFRAHQ